MNWSDFIKHLLDHDLRLSSLEVELKTGIRQPVIDRWKKGEVGKPQRNTIKRLEEGLNIKIDDRDPDNITYTKLPMTNERFGKLLEGASKFENALPVREYPVLATVYAGEPEMLEYEHTNEKTIFAYDKPGHKCFALRVSGKSMETTLKDGDMILVDMDVEIIDGCMVAVKTKAGKQLIKRYHQLDDVYIKLTSDNNDYGVLLVKREEIEACHRVVAISFLV